MYLQHKYKHEREWQLKQSYIDMGGMLLWKLESALCSVGRQDYQVFLVGLDNFL